MEVLSSLANRISIVATWARVVSVFGLRSVSLIPLMTPAPTAQRNASSAQPETVCASVKASRESYALVSMPRCFAYRYRIVTICSRVTRSFGPKVSAS